MRRPPNRPFDDILNARLTRRGVLKGAAWGAALAALGGCDVLRAGAARPTFAEVPGGASENLLLSPGYRAQVLLRWGDAVYDDAPPFDPLNQTPEAQARQFGFNNDFTAFLPLSNDRGLLCVNHEYTNGHMMFPGLTQRRIRSGVTRAQAMIEQAAQGISIVEIRRAPQGWERVAGSRYHRRLTALDTVFAVSGPAAGHPRLRTSADPTGRSVVGTFANCSGGVTPWGTLLSCEENIDERFEGDFRSTAEARNHRRFGLDGKKYYGWHRFFPRFDVVAEPHEPNRFGWVVEVDPFDPTATPIKRTALGRFKHEGAAVAQTPDGRLAIYMGDDQYFEYVYRFVTRRAWSENDRDLLDDGVLSVARFEDDGTLRWLPLVHGEGPLTPANGFHGQGDVLIETRRAADLLGATPMDRPEGAAVSPTGAVVVALAKNPKRTKTDAANPRARNRTGHLLTLLPPAGDHGAETFRWEILLMGGEPKDAGSPGWFVCPDNVAFDPAGNLWLCTDGRADIDGLCDGLYAVPMHGDRVAGQPRQFLRAPLGTEPTGPSFTPDGRTLFLSLQHPSQADDNAVNFSHPLTRWPDFSPSMPPRPAMLAITREDGGVIG